MTAVSHSPNRLVPAIVIPRLTVLVAACTMLGSVLTGTPLNSANDRSRWATVWSLVHRGTWQIDEIDRDPHWTTIDKVRHRLSEDEPYHFYSSKPPFLSAVAAGLYFLQRRVFGADLRRHPAEVTRGILVVINALPMILGLWMFQRLLMRLRLDPSAQTGILMAAGFGSMLNPYLSVLNNHTPAAVCLLICLVTIARIQQTDAPAGRDFAVVGLTAALTSCLELPAALFGIVSFVWMLKRDARRTLLWYVPAALVPLAVFFITNWQVTGGIRPFYAYYGTDRYLYVHNGVPSYWMNPQGLDAAADHPLIYLFHCLFGHHGLFSHTPLLLLAVWGWLRPGRSANRSGLRGILPVGALVCTAVLLFYLSRTQNYNYGGNSVALRWMLWLTPFFWFAMIDPIERLLDRPGGRRLFAALLAMSVVTVSVSLPFPWRPSWIYAAMERAGWIDYRTKVADFDPARWSVFAPWPTQPGTTGSWVSGDGQRLLILKSRGSREVDGQTVCDVSVQMRCRRAGRWQDLLSTSCAVVLPVFADGQPVSKWLMETDVSGRLQPASEELQDLFRGMPASREYRPSGVRWFQRTPDSPGYRCERAASRVAADAPGAGRCWHRCDVWYCEDLPFGVLRWKQTVTRESTREPVHILTWTSTSIVSEPDVAAPSL